jgi:hypothetical protein
MFMIAPSHPWWKEASPPPGRPVPENFRYASDSNPSWITAEQLRELAGIPAPEEVIERGRSASILRLQEALASSKKETISPARVTKL